VGTAQSASSSDLPKLLIRVKYQSAADGVGSAAFLAAAVVTVLWHFFWTGFENPASGALTRDAKREVMRPMRLRPQTPMEK
jgi:hypothetical protein